MTSEYEAILQEPWAGFSRLDIGPYKIGIAITDEDGEQDPEEAGQALADLVQRANRCTISTEELNRAAATAYQEVWAEGTDTALFEHTPQHFQYIWLRSISRAFRTIGFEVKE